ncbi:ABC transporter permease [Roseivirga pacifica]|uniref:ABC transporter permease n=1 Tax=Roseivirga pacifica TaxID=1267423 RepID=UPI002096241E|nr:ABC transporter permease [Roseivirga pacifica]MCO6360177.1 FtsX-like permease family protein [Roseivirga pacifica]MCO6367548.1 FtsX-like permease family protein [Roseivirga pacifica]MCO6369920.1 FtsX-like permease family protein [Roseivirga pacifica]MCO6375205.1 FtsX-like permease family protein [Roseivirga pacifica]MCO6380463.1 FtsX-like permease family protein [Roseivirga pacifica]
MFKNFLKVTLRSVLKSKVFAFINVIGLGLALACCIVAYLNYDFAKSFDDNHLNKDEIYMLSSNRQMQANEVPYNFAPAALANRLKEDVPGLKHVSRYNTDGITIKSGNRIFNRNIGFGDEDFFEMFTFPLKYGSIEHYNDISYIYLSNETAIALFGDVNPMGETVELVNNDGPNWIFKVGGVFEPIPENTLMQFQSFTNWENYVRIKGIKRNDWAQFVAAVYVQTTDASLAERIPGMMQKYIPIQNEARKDFELSSFWVQSMEEAPVNQRDLYGGWMWQAMNEAAIVAPNIMAILILLLACFNFTNTAIAMSNKRLKEIGVRKTLGGSREQLMLQFLAENLFLCLMALIVGLAVATWLVPAYSAMWPGLTIHLSFSQHPDLLFFLIAVLLGTALLAGGYPALYVSRFKPVSILRGTLKVNSSSILAKILLSIQFMISVLALVSGFAFLQNASYQENLDQGYEKEKLIMLPMADAAEMKQMRNTITSNPLIQETAPTRHHIGWGVPARPVKNKDQEFEVDIMDIGVDYMLASGMQVLAGRPFDKANQELDRTNSIVVNQKMARNFGYQNPEDVLGETFYLFDTIRYSVVGVVKDFFDAGLWDPIDPIMMRLFNEDEVSNLLVKVDASQITQVDDYLEATWPQVVDDRPYSGFIQEEGILGEAKEVNANIVTIFVFLSVIAIILSAIGLFTLVSINILSRTKEIGIRKVLGATVMRITTLINRPFLILVSVGAVLGSVAGYYLTQMLMDTIWTYHMDMNSLTFIVPIVSILLIALISISGKVVNAARQNPVKSLRYE